MKRALTALLGLVAMALLVWRCRRDLATNGAAPTTASTTQTKITAADHVDPRQQKRGSIAGAVRDAYLRASKDCNAPCRLELQLIPNVGSTCERS